MRVRTGRFVGLRLRGKSRNSKLVEQGVGQRKMDGHCRVAPPPSAIGSYLRCGVGAHPPSAKLPVDGCPPLPVLELQRPQPMAHPLVEGGKDLWRIGDPEWAFHPARYVPSSLHTAARLSPAERRVISRTRSFMRARACGATRRVTARPLATRVAGAT